MATDCGGTTDQLHRLVDVMTALRSGCPWDAEQTHRSLVHYLVEETLEVVEAIETGDDQHLREELGDLLLQVVFHAEIARREGRFDIEDVARGISDKLIARHPYVFAGADVPDDLMSSWEQRKQVEKGRTSSLDGIPDRMSALTRANKVISRAGWHAVDVPVAAVDAEPISATALGAEILKLAARAQAAGIDPEQATRDALRDVEVRIRDAEANKT